MARTELEATPQLRVAYALHKARTYRHHRDCFCRMYQRAACNEGDAHWTRRLNDELERMPR